MAGRRIGVTGASSGIGAATARRLAAEGGELILAGRDRQRLERLGTRLRATGATVEWLTGDVGEPAHGERLIELCLERLGGLEALVCCAGEFAAADALATGPELWDRQLAINVRGSFLPARAAMAAMRDLRPADPAVVLVGSLAGRVGQPGLSAYGASKFGVGGLVAHLAVEGAVDGIRVNGVAPGTTLTEPVRGQPAELTERLRRRHPLGRLAEPAEIALPICFLASPEASFVSGVMLGVDGGCAAG